MTNKFNLNDFLTGDAAEVINNELRAEINKQIKELEYRNKPSTIIKRYTVGVATKIAGAILVKRGKLSIKKTALAVIVAESIDTIIGYQLNKHTIKSNKELLTKRIKGEVMAQSLKSLEQYAEIQINKTLKIA